MQTTLLDPSDMFEAQYNLIGKLPKIYKDFYDKCDREIPRRFLHTTLNNDIYDLNEQAIWLLEKKGVENILGKYGFVFQFIYDLGFWYIELDGNEDPIVNCWTIKRSDPYEVENLSSYLFYAV